MAVKNEDIKKSVKKVDKKLKTTSKKLEEKDVVLTKKIKKNESKLKAQDQKDIELQDKIRKNRERVVKKSKKLEEKLEGEKKAKKVIKKDLNETKERVDELEKLIKGKFSKKKTKSKPSKITIKKRASKKKNSKKQVIKATSQPTEIKIVLPETKTKKVRKIKKKSTKKTTKIISIKTNKPKKVMKKKTNIKVIKSNLVDKTKLKVKEQEKEIRDLKRKLHKKNKLIDKYTIKQKEIYDNRQKEYDSLNIKIKKLEKENDELNERLKRKNQKFMESIKETAAPLQEQDLQFILSTAQKENEDVMKEIDKLRLTSKSLEVELERALEKVTTLEKEVNKKTAIIDIMEKGDAEIKGLIQGEIEKTKVRWLGWPEGGIIEEIDLSLTNHSLETLNDIHVEVSIRKNFDLVARAKQLPVKKELKPKEIVKYKVNLFKYLKQKGEYQIELRIFSNNPVREFGIIEKTISL